MAVYSADGPGSLRFSSGSTRALPAPASSLARVHGDARSRSRCTSASRSAARPRGGVSPREQSASPSSWSLAWSFPLGYRIRRGSPESANASPAGRPRTDVGGRRSLPRLGRRYGIADGSRRRVRRQRRDRRVHRDRGVVLRSRVRVSRRRCTGSQTPAASCRGIAEEPRARSLLRRCTSRSSLRAGSPEPGRAIAAVVKSFRARSRS